jgi:hypothetical protein
MTGAVLMGRDISSPFPFMDKPQFCGQVTTIHPTATETLTVTIEDNADAGGSPFVIHLSLVTDRGGGLDVASTMDVCPADARSLAMHLRNAADMVDQADPEVRAGLNGVRCLPMITLCGTRFFLDERLRQLRNVENADHFFDLNDSSWS